MADINNFTSDTVISGTGSAERIKNWSENVSISADAGNDTITCYRESVTINGGGGNDRIELEGRDLIEYANGDGKDTIIGFDANDTLKLMSGSISSAVVDGTDVLFKIGSGSVLLKNTAGRFPINVIDSKGESTQKIYGTIIGGTEGDDNLTVSQSKVIVQPGKGNNTIRLSGSKNIVDYTGGNDIIYGLKADDTIRISDDDILKADSPPTVDGNNLLFGTNYEDDDEENYSLTLIDAANKSFKMISPDGKTLYYTPSAKSNFINDGIVNRVVNNFSNVLIDASKYGEEIMNLADNVTVKSNGFLVHSEYGNNVVLIGGDGDNELTAWGGWLGDETSIISNVQISAGGGNDNIPVWLADGVTINAGKGDDGIALEHSKNVFIRYANGDGNDTIELFDDDLSDEEVSADAFQNFKLRIDGNFSTMTSGSNMVVNVGSGSITIIDGVGHDLNIAKFSNDETDIPGIYYNPKKPSTITVKDPFSGTVDAADYSEKVTLIDASTDSNPVVLKAGTKSTVLRAGSGGSTLIGGAGADKLYGGDDVDWFFYTVGQGNDALYDVEEQDFVSIGGATLDQLAFKDNKNVVTVTFDNDKKSKLTINKVENNGSITFKIGDEELVYGSIPSGAEFNSGKTTLTLPANTELAEGSTIDAKIIASTIKDIDASKFGKSIGLLGNANANVLRAGSGGSTLDGGQGNDKLYGGSGADIFRYAIGEGNDGIYKFDGKQNDVIMLEGEAKLDSTTVKVSSNKIVATLGKGKLTLDDPQGKVTFVDTTGKELYSVGKNLPDGVEYNKNKTVLTVGSDTTALEKIDLSDGYMTTVKEINATAYGGAIEMIGNDNANVLRASKDGSTLNGVWNTTTKKTTSDKLHGGGGKDIFVWDAILGGADQIYNYDHSQGDIISVTGDASFDKTNFKASGAKVVLTIGSNKLTVNDVKDKPIVVVHGEDTIAYQSLPGGITYNDLSKKTALNISDPYTGTVDAADYVTSVVTLNASAATGELVLIGSKKAKALVGGKGKTTLFGSNGADIFTGGEGSDTFIYANGGGKDVINNFNSDTDIVKLSDTTIAVTDFAEKGNDLTLTVGKGSITFKNAPRGLINVVDKNGTTITYKTLPTNVTYNAKKSVVTMTKDFSGTLAASDLGLPVKEINAAASTNAVELRAASNATKITASKGGAKMLGSSENDTLIGGNGNDVFQMSGGSDVFDKYTTGKDKIEITGGTLTDAKVVGTKDVELTFAGGTATVKGVVGKELTINDDSGESKYTFTKTNNTLEKVKAADAGASEFAATADDYWFTETSLGNDEIGSMLGEISTADDAAISAMSTDFNTVTSKYIPILISSDRKKK